jgi:hypothetical protein
MEVANAYWVAQSFSTKWEKDFYIFLQRRGISGQKLQRTGISEQNLDDKG